MLIFSLFSGVLCVLHMGSNDIYDRGKIHLYLNFFDMWGCFGWNCGDMMQNTQWLQYKMCFLVCFCVAVETYLWLSSNSSSVIEFKLIWTYGYFTYICSIPNRWSSCFSPTFFFQDMVAKNPTRRWLGEFHRKFTTPRHQRSHCLGSGAVADGGAGIVALGCHQVDRQRNDELGWVGGSRTSLDSEAYPLVNKNIYWTWL